MIIIAVCQYCKQPFDFDNILSKVEFYYQKINMENQKKELTEQEVQLVETKLECLKIASKHSFSFTDMVKQAKELFSLLNLL